ncbi:unnamed protein product [Cochlearia groenlandica]
MRSTTAMATFFLLLLLALVPTATAVTFQVGDADGWNGGVNYTTWASGKVFRVGDTLEFKYDPSHSVSVVDKSDYDNCDGSRPRQSHSTGDTKIDLTKVGSIYFLCPSFGHCLGGMKLVVHVLDSASSPGPSPSPSPANAETR